MMIEKSILERAIDQCDKAMLATVTVLAGGRGAAGNSFDFNNLMTSKKHLEGLLAAQPSKKK